MVLFDGSLFRQAYGGRISGCKRRILRSGGRKSPLFITAFMLMIPRVINRLEG
jgi:hypothetical protein